MSRIEKALEKALEIRESIKENILPEQKPGAVESGKPLPVFEPGNAIVDPAKVDRSIVSINATFSYNSEQYRKLRSKVMSATKDDFRNIIMTTSSNAGEGKTVTAINLAVSLAQEIDHTVLLVDADLRVPTVHKYLGLDVKRGLSEYLKGEVEISDILIKTGIGKLVLLPAGNPPENPAELISSARMEALVHDMKNRYKDRYIIFDSSPVLVTADAITLCKYMDAVLFVVRADCTLQQDVTKALALLDGKAVLGVVFNNIPKYLSKKLDSYYYNYHSAYHKKSVQR